jgi:hypothetical protein
MTKTSFISTNASRLIVAWVVIALLTISIMKASAVSTQHDSTPLFRPIPALNWSGSF